MEKKSNEMIKGLLLTEKFPTRALIIYSLFVLLCAILQAPITGKIAAISIQNMQLDSAQKEMAMNMVENMGTFTIISSLIGAVVELLISSALLYLSAKLIKVEISYSRCVMLLILVAGIMLLGDYLSMGINLVRGVDQIKEITDVFCTSFAYMFDIKGGTLPYKMLVFLNPFTVIAFAFMAYCLKTVYDVPVAKSVVISFVFLFVYVLFQALMISF